MADADADVAGTLAPQRVAIGLLGPQVIAYDLQFTLMGLSIAAIYHYYWRHGHLVKDTLGIKILAGSVIFLNFLYAITCVQATFFITTHQSRDYYGLLSETWPQCLQPLLDGMVGFLVQGWFARRTAKLFKRKLWTWLYLVVIGFVMVVCLGGAIGVTVTSFNLLEKGYYDGLNLMFAATGGLWLWGSAVVDVTNTATLCYLLQSRVQGFNERTDGVLRKLIRLAIETGSYTAFVAVLGAIFSDALDGSSWKQANINYICWISLPSLYTLSLFTTLSSRDRLTTELHAPPAFKNPVNMPSSFLTGNSNPLSRSYNVDVVPVLQHPPSPSHHISIPIQSGAQQDKGKEEGQQVEADRRSEHSDSSRRA
ncbi:hypothetical protein MNV49_002650 [Pseudohyphozyma bogoriensis]|nr:hypothetical protein MNV49_002650 [Pseudohyphozyma bogoriensis]